MHVCMVTEDFLPNIGGMSQHVYEIGRCLARAQHRVTVVNQVMTPRSEAVEDFEGMTVIRTSFSWSLPKARMVPYTLKLRKTILDVHARSPIDVIHWHDLRAGLAAKFLGIPCTKVFTNHSSSFLMGMKSRLFRSYYRYSFGHAHRVIAPSQELADVTEQLLDKPAVYVPNGFDPSRFYPADASDLRSELGILPHEQVLLVPRRLAPKNGVYVLAQALPGILGSHPGARVVVTGGGFDDERRRIEQHAKEHGCLDRILFMGGVDNQLMPQYYNMADLVIMPSFLEAVSLSALEAMACGKCVVASDVGGLSQLFRGGDWGRLVPSGEPNALAQAVIELLSDEAARQRIAHAARDHVLSRYTWEQVAAQTLAVYGAAANGAAR